MTKHAFNQIGQQEPSAEEFGQELSYRVNELYHALQADGFDRIHRYRHRVEGSFWRSEVAPRLLRAEAEFGVDLCTGTGFVPRILIKIMGSSAKILCIDLSQETLEQARVTLGRFVENIVVHAGDASAIPLPDGSADWVTMNAGLHHIPELQRVFNEIDRVLKGGGRFCLGHEPNAAFFTSRFLFRLERVIWHAFWYLSPVRNLRRVKRHLGRYVECQEACEHLDAINETLAKEGWVSRPLTLAELRKLVDVHAHRDAGHENEIGFNAEHLIESCFPDYIIEKAVFTDYGGEMLIRHPWIRAMFDGIMCLLFPRKGRLFSWIIRKPEIRSNPSNTL